MKDAYSLTTKRYILSLAIVSLCSLSTPVHSHLLDFATLSEGVSQTVVSISALRYSKSKNKDKPSSDDEASPRVPWHDFFQQPPQPPNAPPKSHVGSGLIISKDGEVVTNYHVVKDASKIIVKLNNRRELSAELIGYDKASDIALIKMENPKAVEFSAAKIGSPATLKVGQWVFAVGAPFGFEYTVTAGIVSAKNRSLPAESYVPFIQTDVAINPGNSGGPLFNLQGEVVGINSQIYTRTGSFAGLSFAVPIDLVMGVVRQLKENGKVSRGWLGVLVQEMTWDLAESFGMEYVQGAIVSQVVEDSPAERAGILPRDVLLKFNGIEIENSSYLPPVVGRTQAGKQVDVELLRSKKVITLPVVLGELPDKKELNKIRKPKPAQQVLGLTLRNLIDSEREAPGMDQGGVVVEQVSPGAGSAAGIEANDIVVMVDNKRFKDVDEFESVVKALPFEKFVTILVVRKGTPRFLALKVR